MLTPTDIHLIVGLLCKQSNPNSIDIILGDKIYDIASNENRDVDITISYKNDEGELVSFIGIEVKDHKRKLGTIEVEQLCQKFKDMKSVQKGGIVSASGYTSPAIEKAKYHGIDLYEFKNWDGKLAHIQFDENFTHSEIRTSIKGRPNVTYVFEEKLSETEIADFSVKTKILDSKGIEINHIKNIEELNNNLINQLLNSPEYKEHIDKIEIGNEVAFNQNMEITDTPCVMLSDKLIKIHKVNIQGIIEKKATVMKTEFKVLVKYNDDNSQIGCIISEMPNGSLLGLTTSITDKALKALVIPLPDRLKKKILNLKLK